MLTKAICEGTALEYARYFLLKEWRKIIGAKRALFCNGIIVVSPAMMDLLDGSTEDERVKILSAIDVLPVADLKRQWREAF